ncbi:MAG: hypothetical protein M1834_003236 [Cirrosporium novae-zelandiae]|nr:MAG: hypothetical protein M1834_003236 [Cirrosporium novae-zelandiae]
MKDQEQEEKTLPSHLETIDIEAFSTITSKDNHDLHTKAREAAAAEHTLTLKEAFKTHKLAIFWSVLVSTSIIMEGYDIVLVNSLYAQEAFAKRYGTYTESGGWQLSGAWQSALGAAPTIGAVFGAFINGYLTHKWGYRRVLLVSMVMITAFIFFLFFATSTTLLLVGLILCGLPWGVFATMAPAYASEVCPMVLRGYLTVYVNLCWAFGQLMAAGVMEGLVNRKDQWAYRIPFAVQWCFPLPLLCLFWFAPESPWWLVRTNQLEAAERSLRRLSSSLSALDAKHTVAMMVHTNSIELETETGTSYLDCFKGTDLRRTEIACLTFAAQVWCGSSLGGTPVYFFEQAGLSDSNAFKFNLGGLGLASIGTIISWFFLNRIGRRTIYVWGLAILFFCMLIVGCVSAGAGNGTTSSYCQAGFVLLWLLVYYLTVGPVCYAIISEVSATRLRNKSVCLSRISYYICQITGNVIEPYMVNPTEANWHGKTGFFWAGTCLVFLAWAFWRLPETKDRTFEELDLLFARRVPARKFRSCVVDAYAEGEGRVVKEE